MEVKKIEGLLGPEVGYIDLADLALVEKDEVRRSKPREGNPLRPSAAGFCARKLAYEFNEYRGNAEPVYEEQSPDLQRLFELGHAIEYNMIRMWGQVELFKIKYKQQALTFLKLDGDDYIEGSNDLCVYLPGHRCIGDWKSKGDKWSSYYESKWDELDADLRSMKTVQTINSRVYWVEDLKAFLDELKDPFFKHNFVQLNLYATNEFMVQRGIDHACIWQYDKNKSRLREVRFKPSEEVKDYVLNKFSSIIEAVDQHKDPERIEKEHMLGSSACAFCPYAKRCWPETDVKKAYFKTLPDKNWPRDTSYLGEVGQKIEELIPEFTAATDSLSAAKVVEERICMLMSNAKVWKVRLKDGTVYERKYLKSPRPHYELRRSKP